MLSQKQIFWGVAVLIVVILVGVAVGVGVAITMLNSNIEEKTTEQATNNTASFEVSTAQNGRKFI